MSDTESDAPEEFTAEQGIQQDEEIRKVQKESKARVVREAKEKRKRLAQRKTSQPSKVVESVQDVVETETETETETVTETETDKEALGTGGMLPSDIVQLLAAREKKVFLSDSEDEKAEAKPPPRRKRPRTTGKGTVILKDTAPPKCLQNSLEFLKKRKMQVPRSSSVLDNSNQALRLISNSGLLRKK